MGDHSPSRTRTRRTPSASCSRRASGSCGSAGQPAGGASTGDTVADGAIGTDWLRPGLSFTVGGEPAIAVPAQDGTTLTVTQDAESYAADTAVGGDPGALVVVHQNDTATGRAQSVPIAGTATPPPVG